MLNRGIFVRIRKLAMDLAGIELHDRHSELLGHRCGRRGIRDAAALDALLAAADRGEPAAVRAFLGLLTTKFTGFFRHPRHFDLAAQRAVQAAHRGARSRLWSAGAATGEEPYSLAMALIEAFHPDDPPVDLLATDLDETALEAARRGEYGESALESMEPGRRDRFFRPSASPGRWILAPEVRRRVEFRPLNLIDSAWPVEGPFDAILCRNVLLYLSAACRESVVRRLLSSLTPEGLLILDPVEHPGGLEGLYSSGNDGIFSRRPISRSPDAATTALPPEDALEMKTP